MIARKLIGQQGSIGALLSLSASAAGGDDPIADLMASTRRLLAEALRGELLERPVISTSAELAAYLRFELVHLDVEEVRVLFLNAANHLIGDEVMARGSLLEAPIYPREIIKRALELGATALILAHNHPSGDPTPSQADRDATSGLAAAGRPLGITVHDHVVIACNGWTSLRAEGML